MMAPKSIDRDLIRLHAICFGVLYLLWANYGAKCQLNKGIIFVFVSGFSRDKYSTRSVSVHHIGFIGQDLRSDSHFSKLSQSHILLSGALLFIGHHSRSLEMNGILEVLHGQYLISFQLYFLHYPLFGWCTGLWAYAQLKRASTMPCVKPYTILYWKGEGSTNL